MKVAVWILAALVLAAPAMAVDMLQVELSFDPDPRIVSAEPVTGTASSNLVGQWRLVLEDADGLVLQERTFDPTIIGNDAQPSLVDELHVSIVTSPSADRIVLLNDQGVREDTYALSDYCGDGVCTEAEEPFCQQDCLLAEEGDAAIENLSTYQEPGMPAWKTWTLAGAALLIIVLILVLIHLNRKKQNPIQLDT